MAAHVDRDVRIVRFLRHAVFDASRAGRAAEVCGWSNAVASIGLGVGIYFLFHSVPGAIGTAILAFVLLRAALVNRFTLWIAAACGSLAVSAAGGALTWLFAHVIEHPAVPPIAGAVGAIACAAVPAWAYAQMARLREHARDSLIDPVSVPSSH